MLMIVPLLQIKKRESSGKISSFLFRNTIIIPTFLAATIHTVAMQTLTEYANPVLVIVES